MNKSNGLLSVSFHDMEKLIRNIDKFEQVAPKAVKATVNNFIHGKGKTWVNGGVRKIYNIKSARINKAYSKSSTEGKVNIAGILIPNQQLVYTSRAVTAREFSMSPSTRPKAKKRHNAYGQVAAEFFVGQKKNLGPDVFLGTGNNGLTFPFIKAPTSGNPHAIKVVHSVTVPQMITGAAADKVGDSIMDGFEKQLNFNINKYMKKI